MRHRTIRGLFKSHLYIGTALALPLLLIASTGILLGFYDELRYAAAPYRLAMPVYHGLDAPVLAERIQAAYPTHHLERLYLPTAPERTARVRLSGYGQSLLVFLHPGTGAILAIQDAADQDWLEFLYNLHRGKPLELAGQIIASASGVFVLVLWILGMWLWWRRPARHRPWHGRSLFIKAISTHRWLGLMLGGIITCLTVVGALLNFAGPLMQWLDPPPILSSHEPGSQPLPLRHIVSAATDAYRQVPLERIYFPAQPSHLFQLRFQDGSWVYLEPDSGKIVKIKIPFSHWTRLLYPLHSGRILGDHGSWLIALCGVVLLLLSGSGLMHWRRQIFSSKSKP